MISFAGTSLNLEQIDAEIASSSEADEVDHAVTTVRAMLEAYSGHCKILLFGAYGNGNLGDREMAKAVADVLERNSRTVCFSYSALATADYPFAEGRKLTSTHKPLNIRILRLFDALVVGGGGLLSYEHMPIWEPIWKYTIPIPYALLSCGTEAPIDNRLVPLVSGAAVASARDERGQRELQKHNAGALLCHDPMLAFGAITTIGQRRVARKTPRRLYILRAPLTKWHSKVKENLRADDLVVVFEAHVDFPILYSFANSIVCSSISEFRRLVSDFDVVISERYHGLILSLLAHVPAIGITRGAHQSKIGALFSTLGIADYCFDENDAPTDVKPYPFARVSRALAAVRARAHDSYSIFINQLLDYSRYRKSFMDSGDPSLNGSLIFKHLEAAYRKSVRNTAQLSTENTELRTQLSLKDVEVLAELRKLDGYRDEATRLQQENLALKDTVEDMFRKMQGAATYSSEVKVQLAVSEKSREELAGIIASATEENALLQATVAEHHVQYATLTAALTETQAAREALECTLNASKVEQERLRTTLVALQSDLQDAAANVLSRETQCAELLEQKREALADSAQLSGEVNRLNMELASLQAAKLQSEQSASAMEMKLTQAMDKFKEHVDVGFSEMTRRLTEFDQSNQEIGLLTNALLLAGEREAKLQQSTSLASEQVKNLIAHLAAQQNRNAEFAVKFFEIQTMLRRLASLQVAYSPVAEGAGRLSLSNLSRDTNLQSCNHSILSRRYVR